MPSTSTSSTGRTGRAVGFGEALRRGFGAARGARGVVGLAFLAEAGTDLLSFGVTLTVGGLVLGALGRTVLRDPMLAFMDPDVAASTFAGQLLQRQTLFPLAGVLLTAALISVALRLLWYTSAARTFGLSLGGEAPPGAMAAASRLSRAVPVAALFVPIYAAVMLYDFTAIGSGWLAFTKALQTRSGGFGGALSLALATSLAALIGFFVDSLFRLALVRSVTTDAGPIDAIVDGARLFARNAPTLVGLSVTFGFMDFVASTIAGTGGAFVIGSGAASVALNLYARALSGLVGSLALAFLQSAQLGALATLEAGDRGVLPEPPPPPPPPAPPVKARPLETLMVVQSEPVLETQLAAVPEVLQTQLVPEAGPAASGEGPQAGAPGPEPGGGPGAGQVAAGPQSPAPGAGSPAAPEPAPEPAAAPPAGAPDGEKKE